VTRLGHAEHPQHDLGWFAARCHLMVRAAPDGRDGGAEFGAGGDGKADGVRVGTPPGSSALSLQPAVSATNAATAMV
jgi:hypothetical protein